ncbi:MAG: dipeptidase [Simkaniaceae bacterium]|nr:dipeptidase [Candidatus Sacchlamyda saccharinae]
MDLTSLKKWYSTYSDDALKDFFRFLQFKSISTDQAYDKSTKDCATWLTEYLNGIGMQATCLQTSGHPVVFATHTKAGKDKPTLLIYQHYDVQPVDPIELWESDPFEPIIRNGEIYARGAQDNKGQCFYTITALKAFLEQVETLNFNIKLFIEGEEESGSNGTLEVLGNEELKSDYLLVVDSGIPAPGEPAITLGLRGILTMELQVRMAETDLHSGGMGGIAYNPIRALTHALAKCYDEEGRVAVPNFYDDVKELTADEKKRLDFSCDEDQLQKDFGLKGFCPDPGYPLGESVSTRPTLEINGITGGYTGAGFKTVLPAVASAKISCRLVPDQDPDKLFQAIQTHIKQHLPEGAEVTLTSDHGSRAFRCDPESLIAKRAKVAYEEVMGKPCKSILFGGSIPITAELITATGAEGLVMGFGLDTDNIHAPNEHFGLDRFELGFLTMGRILGLFNEE